MYLNSRGTYVNGKSVSGSDLSKIIRESGLDQVVISAERYVPRKKVAYVEELIREAGVKEVKRTEPLRFEQTQNEKILEILSRQKGEQLKVYLNSRATYVNGKTVSASDLTKIVSESGLDQVVVSAEKYVSRKKVAYIEELIRKAGAKDVKRTEPQRFEQTKDEKILEILSRQKGE